MTIHEHLHERGKDTTMDVFGRSWTVECPWCDDGDYIDPRGNRHRCAHCNRTNEVEVVPLAKVQGAVRALERIAAVDYGNPGMTPLESRLRNVVAIARSALERLGGR